jgi:inner membrane protein
MMNRRMASAFTHVVVAAAMGRVAGAGARPWKFWLWAAACSVLPDADVVGFRFGIRYEEMLGHRGLTHSLPFAAAVGLALAALAFREVPRFKRDWWKLVGFLFAVTASHGVLDALTDGGLGVAFFAPFSNERFFFPWTPIEVSPISIGGFFSDWGRRVLISEALVVWLPCGVVVGVVELWRWRRARSHAQS